MAFIDRATVVYSNGNAERTALYAIRNVTTGDTLDAVGEFSVPKQAIFLGTTVGQKGVCTISGTVVTVSTTGLAGDAGYLLVYGSAA